jgi:hypothetical protein
MVSIYVYLRNVASAIHFTGEYSWEIEDDFLSFRSEKDKEEDYHFNQDDVVYFTLVSQ